MPLFPGMGYGICNCRNIGSDPSRPWSQHAGCNAMDLWSPHKPRVRLNPLHMRYMDRVYRYLQANRAVLGIRTVLWRTTAHWDHIHVDFWPKLLDDPSYRPPCKGGQLVVVYPDGRRGDKWALYPENAPPPIPPQENEMLLPIQYGHGYEIPPEDSDLSGDQTHKKEDVRHIQELAGLTGADLDGVYGMGTAAAVAAALGAPDPVTYIGGQGRYTKLLRHALAHEHPLKAHRHQIPDHETGAVL